MTTPPPNSEDEPNIEISYNDFLLSEEDEDISDEADFATDYSESDTELRDYKIEQNAKYRKFLNCLGRRTYPSYGSSSSDEASTANSLTLAMSTDSTLDSDRTLCANSFRYNLQGIEVDYTDTKLQDGRGVVVGGGGGGGSGGCGTGGNVVYDELDIKNRTKMTDNSNANKNLEFVSTKYKECGSKSFCTDTDTDFAARKKLKNKQPKSSRVPFWVTQIYNEPMPGENISTNFYNDSDFDNRKHRSNTKPKHCSHSQSSGSNDRKMIFKSIPDVLKTCRNVSERNESSTSEMNFDLNNAESKSSIRSKIFCANKHSKTCRKYRNQIESKELQVLHFKHDSKKFPRFVKSQKNNDNDNDNFKELDHYTNVEYISCEDSEINLYKNQTTADISKNMKNNLGHMGSGDSDDIETCRAQTKNLKTHNSLQPKQGKLNIPEKKRSNVFKYVANILPADLPTKQSSKMSVASSSIRNGNSLRKNFSFTNEEVRVIERHNKILLQKMMNVKSTLSTIQPKPKYQPQPPQTQPMIEYRSMPYKTNRNSSAINRKNRQRQIQADNLILKKKLDLIASRRRKY